MKARITNKNGYKCAPNGHSVISFQYGAEVEGRVAKWAIDDCCAVEIDDLEAKIVCPPETKRRTRRAAK